MRRPLRLAAVLFALGFAALAAARDHRPHADGAGFDQYLMSLSWSPSYCATHADESEQCGDRGFGFVLHGLWPQYRAGGGPQHCRTDAAPDEATIRRALAFMPSRRLIEHEWRTHGSCSGLDPADYFDLADHAFASVRIPPPLIAPTRPPRLSAAGIVQAFRAVNPALPAAAVHVACRDGDVLAEVRVFLDRHDLAPRACGGGMRDTCRDGVLTIPAIR